MATMVTTEPEIVHTGSVVEVKLTGSPELAVAAMVNFSFAGVFLPAKELPWLANCDRWALRIRPPVYQRRFSDRRIGAEGG